MPTVRFTARVASALNPETASTRQNPGPSEVDLLGITKLIDGYEVTLRVGKETDHTFTAEAQFEERPSDGECGSTRIEASSGKCGAGREVGELLNQVAKRASDRARNPSTVTGLSTGFSQLDEITGGLHPGELTILASYSRREALHACLNITEHIALRSQLPVLVFPAATRAFEVTQRLVCLVAGVEYWKLRDGQLEADGFKRIGEAFAALGACPMRIDDRIGMRVHELAHSATQYVRRVGGAGIVLVEDLLMLAAPDRKAERGDTLSHLLRELRALAVRLNLPVVGVLPLVRLHGSPEARPVLHELKELPSLREFADVLLLIYREGALAEIVERPVKLEICIAKHPRSGHKTVVGLYWPNVGRLVF